jgi:hypothetical protein
MLIRAVAVWCVLVVLAVLNGGARNVWLSPRLGEQAGHVVSTFTLSCVIFLATWLTIGWIRPTTLRDTMHLGTLWLVLTVLFEFGAGHFLFGNSWEKLLTDYHLLRGRVWVLVLIVTLIAPMLAARLRGLVPSSPP